jgi:hypothetical protein
VSRRPSTPKLCHLLLQGPRPQPPPLTMLMAPTRVIPLIERYAVAASTETKPICLRLSHQGGACREACFNENFKGCAL